MRNYLLAAVAAAALTSPALARDKSTYVGISGGVMLVEDTNLDYSYDVDVPEVRDAITVDHKLGFDVDLFAGYDFGLVRAEAEVAYKRASIDEVQLDTDFIPSPNPTEPYDANGKVSVFSVMANALFDFGDEDGWHGFLGAGVGYAKVKYKASIPTVFGDAGFSDSDGTIAWQILAGVSKSVSPNIDLGLKYRFFNASKLKFGDNNDDEFEFTGRFRSHSLMASLVYNFYTPEAPPPPPPLPPPPPPPPPPATQTCPDGSVILATDACPPPPPPPPPPPEPERG